MAILNLRAGVLAALVVACQPGLAGLAPTADPSPAESTPQATSTGTPVPTPTATPTETATGALASPTDAVDPRSDGFAITFGEFAITLETPAIRPGPVTFVIKNAGKLTHGFELKADSSNSGPGSNSGSGSGRDRLKIETRTFKAGETLRVEADLPEGTYEIECFVGNHESRGMHATLEVRKDAPLSTANPGTIASGTVRIVQFAFVAPTVEVPTGSRVTWINDDPAPHTVTADDGSFDSRQLDAGASFDVVLDKPGVFAYHCEIHPTMVGTVIAR